MKKVRWEGDRVVLSLSLREWALLCALLQFGDGFDRVPGSLSRGGLGDEHIEAQAFLKDTIAEGWADDRSASQRILSDTGRCLTSGPVAILNLTIDDIETLLRALNGRKMSAWEALGCPDFDDEPPAPPSPKDLRLRYFLDAADELLCSLLRVLA
jgi:hypothetical protein